MRRCYTILGSLIPSEGLCPWPKGRPTTQNTRHESSDPPPFHVCLPLTQDTPSDSKLLQRFKVRTRMECVASCQLRPPVCQIEGASTLL